MDFEHGVMWIFNTGSSIKGWISEMGSIEVKKWQIAFRDPYEETDTLN